MIRRDAEVIWRPGRIYIPVTDFSGLQTVTTMKGGAAGTALGYDSDAAGFKITKAAVTDRASVFPVQLAAVGVAADPTSQTIRQVSTAPVTGLLMANAGDDISHYMQLPYDMDITQPIYFHVHWTSEAAAVGARTITWRVRYLKIIPNTTALAAATTALDTAIGAQAPLGTTMTVQKTTVALQGVLDPRTTTIADTVEAIILRVDMSAFNAAFVENKYLLGLSMRYTPKRLYGVDGMRQEAKAGTNMFSKDTPN